MSGSGLKVRCLASTRVSDLAWQEQELKKDEHDAEEYLGKHDIADATEGDGVFRDPVNEATLGEDKFDPDDHSIATPTSSSQSNSDSNSDNESDAGSSSDDISTASSRPDTGNRHTSCIQEAQLSSDGTCIFTSDYNRSFSVYPIDTSIANEASTRGLKPYAQFTSSDPIWAFAANPLFDVNDPNSTHVLVSRRDRYITLHNALWDVSQPDYSEPTNSPIDISHPLAFYKLINSLTEAVTAPLSLMYSHSGTHFFAGLRNSIATFSLDHADAPIHSIPTIPSARSKLKGGGRGFKGWISALALSPPTTFCQGGMLAAGARTRHVGIYDAVSGEEVTTFSLPGTVDGKKLPNENLRHIVGDGVSSLKYSPCAKYLYVAERASDVLLIYDVRNFSLSLGYCTGRAALTKQKLGFDIWNAGSSPYGIEAVSHEVWAGGTDGMVRVWRDPYVKEGAVEPDEVVSVGEGDVPVAGTMVHASGGLAVAACGKVDVGGDGVKGRGRGGKGRPRFNEWGSLEILGLS